jgi:hypothetical protein
MLSENAHVTPILMLLGNTHCEIEVKKEILSPPALLQTFLQFLFRRRNATFFYIFFLVFSPLPWSGTDTNLIWRRFVIAVAVVRWYAHGGTP